jgi:trans-aconitate methyltransferase
MSQTQTWSPQEYARNAAFVPALGASILAQLAPQPGERILDLGCGDGVLTQEIAAAGATVVAVDASPAMVAAARTRGLDARVADATALPFVDEFDAVFSNAVLHWVKAADAALAGIARALKPGGRFVAEFGGFMCVASIHTAVRAVLMRRGIAVDSPWFFPTAEQYREQVEAAGLRVDAIRTFARPTPLPTGIEGWLDTFAGPMLGELGANDRPEAVAEIARLLEPALRDWRGTWTADYVRLQVVAFKLPA